LAAIASGSLDVAFWLVAAGAAFDFSDGLAARLLGQYSPLGKQLDSLADMVTFGVAPSAIVYNMMIRSFHGSWLPLAAFIIAAFSALRLARFNIDENQSDAFTGLPTPANALFFASLGWMFAKGDIRPDIYMLLGATVVMSALLVCPIRMFSLKFHSLALRGNTLRFIFLAAAAIALAIFRIPAIPAIIGLYIIVSVIARAFERE
jgi:CDP-diacylglycerol--serine O-phosphatidyltransferase